MSLILDGTNGLTFNNATVQNSGSKVLQVVSAYSNTQISTTSNTPVASGFSASITPLFSTSKILVMFNGEMGAYVTTNTNVIGTASIYRGSSTQLTASRFGASAITQDFNTTVSMTFLDSPATTSSVTYNLYWSRYSSTFDATIYINQATNSFGQGSSTITLLEIAA